MIVPASVAVAIIIILGIIFSKGKGSFLIAGYNTMKKEEKEKYNTVALCKFMGKCMFALAFSMILWLLSDLLNKHWLFIIGLILFLLIIVFMIVYTNTSKRFKK